MGALIMIPFFAVLRVLVERVIAPAIRERTGAPPPESEQDEDGDQ